MSRLYAETKDEGKRIQRLLKAPLEAYFKESLTETYEEHPFDYKANSFWLEIKGRDFPYRSDDKWAEKGWWIGYPKVLACRKTKKPVYFIYYFVSDSTCWLLESKESLFAQFAPFQNSQGQWTVAVPKEYWTKLCLPPLCLVE